MKGKQGESGFLSVEDVFRRLSLELSYSMIESTVLMIYGVFGFIKYTSCFLIYVLLTYGLSLLLNSLFTFYQ